MKKYENESTFVNMFSKDAKESIKTNGRFEAQWNGIAIVITAMDNNNPSKVTMYSGTLDGTQFTGSITALKKRLNIEYTKAYNRTNESAKSANTKVVIKTDEELKLTAENEYKRYKQALEALYKFAGKYCFAYPADCELETTIFGEMAIIAIDNNKEDVTAYILSELKRERDAAAERKRIAEERAAQKQEAKRIAAKAIEDKRNRIMAELAEASAQQQFERVMELSKELAKLK